MDLYDYALTGSTLLFGYLAIQLKSTINKNNEELSKYKDLTVHAPKFLIDQIKYNKKYNTRKPSNTYDPVGQFFVAGEITCDNPLQSLTSPKTKLIYRLYSGSFIQKHEHLGEHDYKLSDPIKVSKTYAKEFVAFGLKSGDKRTKMNIIPNVGIDCNYAMETLGKDMQLPNQVEDESWYVPNMIGNIFKSSNDKVLKLSTYFVDKEYGVKVGGFVTVFGQVLYNSEKKDVKMHAEVLLKNVNQIRAKMWENTKNYFMLGLLIGGLCVSGGFLIKRMIRLYDKFAYGIKAPELKRSNTQTVLTDDYKCVICFMNPKNIILRPCMHFLMCLACYNLMISNNCPVCREPVEDYLQIFLP